jgi:hypothetical protein
MKKGAGIFHDFEQFVARGAAAQRAVDEVGAEARDVGNLVLRLSSARGILEELVAVDAARYEPLRQRVADLLVDVRKLT